MEIQYMEEGSESLQENGRLEWDLLISTKDRIDDLEECVRAALLQTRLPKEVIVVDASGDFSNNEARLATLVTKSGTDVALSYIPATLPSLTNQRNQALDIATSDIVFMIDDDSFMYSDCAEEIMKIYEADISAAITGVQAVLADRAPTHLKVSSKQKAIGGGGGKRTRIAAFLYRKLFLMSSRDLFVPYDGTYPEWSLPASVHHLDVSREVLFHGARMTFRRERISFSRFDPVLRYYCPYEDLDGSYRVSRSGCLATAKQARLYHHTSATSRLQRRRVAELGTLNQAALIRRHASDLSAARRAFWVLQARRVLAEALKDGLSRRFNFPQLRGVLAALPQARKIFTMEKGELERWYFVRQEEIVKGPL